ncbi:GRP family sugar transporter [Levilactobacillus yonginensis]|uniref:GRP family sugar transporter n=1 Tax=Levilactobacillus yonginensis TaxID=1054041 RepID=UPI00345CB9A3
MNLLIGLLPALFWGVLPIWMQKKTGGSFLQQLLGTSSGIVISAIILQLIFRFHISWPDFLLYYLSGACWSIGQGGQYWGYTRLGVSNAVPVSTAFQIIGNSLIGGWAFGEWAGWHDSLLGILALIIILIGVMVTNGMIQIARDQLGAYLLLLVTAAGYWGYSAFPHFVSGATGLNGFLPQSLGMLTTSFFIYLGGRKKFSGNDAWGVRNITSGLIFSVAAATYLISLRLNGLVNAFILTQLNVVVSTILGIVILREADAKQLKPTTAGLAILIFGAVVMVQI